MALHDSVGGLTAALYDLQKRANAIARPEFGWIGTDDEFNARCDLMLAVDEANELCQDIKGVRMFLDALAHDARLTRRRLQAESEVAEDARHRHAEMLEQKRAEAAAESGKEKTGGTTYAVATAQMPKGTSKLLS